MPRAAPAGTATQTGGRLRLVRATTRTTSPSIGSRGSSAFHWLCGITRTSAPVSLPRVYEASRSSSSGRAGEERGAAAGAAAWLCTGCPWGLRKIAVAGEDMRAAAPPVAAAAKEWKPTAR